MGLGYLKFSLQVQEEWCTIVSFHPPQAFSISDIYQKTNALQSELDPTHKVRTLIRKNAWDVDENKLAMDG